jgi:hypothetical protein
VGQVANLPETCRVAKWPETTLAIQSWKLHIKWLELGGTRIGDAAGVDRLGALKQLKRLGLGGTRITDAAVRHLTGMKHIVRLELQHTNVSAEGVRKIEQALPDCDVRSSVPGRLPPVEAEPGATPITSGEAWQAPTARGRDGRGCSEPLDVRGFVQSSDGLHAHPQKYKLGHYRGTGTLDFVSPRLGLVFQIERPVAAAVAMASELEPGREDARILEPVGTGGRRLVA